MTIQKKNFAAMTRATGVEKGGTIARTCVFLQQEYSPLATLQQGHHWLVMMTLFMTHNLVVVVRTQLWHTS